MVPTLLTTVELYRIHKRTSEPSDTSRAAPAPIAGDRAHTRPVELFHAVSHVPATHAPGSERSPVVTLNSTAEAVGSARVEIRTRALSAEDDSIVATTLT